MQVHWVGMALVTLCFEESWWYLVKKLFSCSLIKIFREENAEFLVIRSLDVIIIYVIACLSHCCCFISFTFLFQYLTSCFLFSLQDKHAIFHWKAVLTGWLQRYLVEVSCKFVDGLELFLELFILFIYCCFLAGHASCNAERWQSWSCVCCGYMELGLYHHWDAEWKTSLEWVCGGKLLSVWLLIITLAYKIYADCFMFWFWISP